MRATCVYASRIVVFAGVLGCEEVKLQRAYGGCLGVERR